MPKLLWVLAPLLIASAAWAIQALRGRRPSRHALNVWASVLLLGYLLATAGLGVFWVASQQLPVFDWHYLFGYGTLALVAVHLAFNFRIVWRALTRRRIRRDVAAATPRRGGGRGRRRALGWSVAALASAAAFWLGTLRGRNDTQEPSRLGAGPGETAADAALAAVERFHAVSSHSRTGLFLRAPSLDWSGSPVLFKHYPGAALIALPESTPQPTARLDVAALGHVLWHTNGITERRSGLDLRASPSSGALFPSELYVFCRGVDGIADGWWHHDAQAHVLESLPAAARGIGDLGDLAAAAPEHGPAAFVVATAVFRRTGHKYRDRTYRYVVADLGHALENLRVAGGTIGIEVTFVAPFDQATTAAAIGVDEAEEGVLAAAALHAGPSVAAAAAPPAATATRPDWRPLAAVDPASAVLGVTATIHAATSIRRAATRASADAGGGPEPTSASEAIALPVANAGSADIAAVIARRRSIRRFAKRALPLDDLAAVLASTTAPPSPTFSSALHIDVVVHDVAGLRPGVYRYRPERHALVARRGAAGLRSTTRAAGLDQDVVGDGAAVLVLSMDRRTMAADPLGPARGYRHGFLEAGLVVERVYLAAGARALGACSVGAFYDDEAAALVGVDPAREWVLHFVALGIPDRA